MNSKNNIDIKRKPFQNTKSVALGVALIIGIPLYGGNDTSNKDLEVEKQFSMVDEVESPKEAGVNSVGSDNAMTSNKSEAYSDNNSAMDSESRQVSQSLESPHASEMKSGTHMSTDKEYSQSERQARQSSENVADPYESDSQVKIRDENMSHDGKLSDYSKADNSRDMTSNEIVNVTSWRDLKVQSSDNETIGEVEDVVVDLDSSEAHHLLVDNNGILTGSRLLPISKVGYDMSTGHLKVNVTEEEYEAMPKYQAQSDDVDQKDSADYTNTKSHLSSQQALCSNLVGKDVEFPDGSELGDIEAIAQIPNTADVYAILGDLETDNFESGADIDRIAVKFSLLEQMTDDDELRLKIDQKGLSETLKKAGGNENVWRVYNGEKIVFIDSLKESWAVK